MRGFLAGAAEVIRIARDGVTEMPEPDAIRDGARGERVVLARHPFGKSFAPALDAIRNGHLLHVAEHTQDAGQYCRSVGEGIAADVNARVFELAFGHPIR